MTNAFTANRLFGDLFSDDQVAAAFGAPAFMDKMIRFETAWTQALVHAGTVDAEQGRAALSGLAEFQPDHAAISKAANRDGLPVPALVTQIRAAVPEDARDAVHKGATSQDVIDTALVLTCLELIDLFADRLSKVIALIKDLDRTQGRNGLMGRTRMQAALPVEVQDRLGLWRQPLTRLAADVEGLKSRLGIVQAGGPVGLRDIPGGKGDAVAAHVAETLGLATGAVWHTDRSAMIDLGTWLVKISGALGKIGQDVSLMAQQGIEEIAIEGAGGSSAMPHKQNPVHAEALVTLAQFVAGQQGVLGLALIHEQERSGAAWALEWLTLPAMFEATGAALNNAVQLLSRVGRIGNPV